MTPFEYVSVLISIILGLGITQIVTGLADLIHQWDRVKVYWPHLLWIFLIFFLHIQEWWATYELKDFDSWRLTTFFFVVFYPTILFILDKLLFPFGFQEGEIDLKQFYFENFRRIFGWAIVLIVFALLTNIFILNYPIIDQLPQFIFLGLLLYIVICNIKNESVHFWTSIIITLVTIGSVIATWSRETSIISQ
jgi:hypothetical protein